MSEKHLKDSMGGAKSGAQRNGTYLRDTVLATMPSVERGPRRLSFNHMINGVVQAYRDQFGGWELSRMEAEDIFLIVASHRWPEDPAELARLKAEAYLSDQVYL